MMMMMMMMTMMMMMIKFQVLDRSQNNGIFNVRTIV